MNVTTMNATTTTTTISMSENQNSSPSKKSSPLFERRCLFSQNSSLSLLVNQSSETETKNITTTTTTQQRPIYHMSQCYSSDEIDEVYFYWLATTPYIKLYEKE